MQEVLSERPSCNKVPVGVQRLTQVSEKFPQRTCADVFTPRCHPSGFILFELPIQEGSPSHRPQTKGTLRARDRIPSAELTSASEPGLCILWQRHARQFDAVTGMP